MGIEKDLCLCVVPVVDEMDPAPEGREGCVRRHEEEFVRLPLEKGEFPCAMGILPNGCLDLTAEEPLHGRGGYDPFTRLLSPDPGPDSGSDPEGEDEDQDGDERDGDEEFEEGETFGFPGIREPTAPVYGRLTPQISRPPFCSVKSQC